MALLDDLVPHGCIERAVEVREEEGVQIALAQPLHGELGEARQPGVASTRSHAEQQRDAPCLQTARDEAQDARGIVVEPVRVIDHTEQRQLLGRVAEQRQRREPDDEVMRGRADTESEHGFERAPLRLREELEVLQHRPAQLVQSAEREPRLRRGPERARNVPAVRVTTHVLEECALSDAGLAAHDDDAACTGPGIGQQPVERGALPGPAEQPGTRSLRSPRISYVGQHGHLSPCLTLAKPPVSRRRRNATNLRECALLATGGLSWHSNA